MLVPHTRWVLQTDCGAVTPQAAVIASAGGAAYNDALEYIRPHGSLVAVGLPPDTDIKANVFWTVFRNVRIIGSCTSTISSAPNSRRRFGADSTRILSQTSVTAKTPSRPSTLLSVARSSRRSSPSRSRTSKTVSACLRPERIPFSCGDLL